MSLLIPIIDRSNLGMSVETRDPCRLGPGRRPGRTGEQPLRPAGAAGHYHDGPTLAAVRSDAGGVTA